MAADIPYNPLGLIFGVIGVFGLIPILWTALHRQLPRSKLKMLDATLEETTALLDKAVQDGFVPSLNFVLESRNSLRRLRSMTESLRTSVLHAHGVRKQCIAVFKGLSKRLDDVYQRASDLHIQVATASEQARRTAEEMQRRESDSLLESSFALPLPIPQSYTANLEQTHPQTQDAVREKSVTLATPPPTFVSHTSVFRQPVRLDSTFFRRSNGGEISTYPWALPSWDGSSAGFAGAPGLDPLVIPIPPPYSRERSISSGQSRRILTGDHDVGSRYIQQPTRAESASDALLDREALIAELREQIVDDLIAGIASAGTHWQSALEHTLHGRSRTQSMSSGDIEAGLLTLSS